MAEHDKAPIDYDSEDHDITRAEHDRPHNSIILALVFATIGSLVVVLLAIIQFFDVSVRNEVTSKVLDVPSSPLRDLRAAENAKLAGYAWVSQQQGVVRIPLDRAIELTARDWESRPSGLVEVKEEAPPPAPAPGAAPTGAAPGTTAPPGSSPTGAPQTPGTPSPNPETLPTGAPAPPPAGTPMAPSSPGAAPTEGATPR
jgi:hypothetical protein